MDDGLLNVIDVEATCWDGPTGPGQVNEIIEIGLTVLDVARRERHERHRILGARQAGKLARQYGYRIDWNAPATFAAAPS